MKFIKDYKKGVIPILFILFLFFGLIMLEPDFGTAMVIILTLIVMIFISGPKLNFFIRLKSLSLVPTEKR